MKARNALQEPGLSPVIVLQHMGSLCSQGGCSEDNERKMKQNPTMSSEWGEPQPALPWCQASPRRAGVPEASFLLLSLETSLRHP